MNNLNILSRTRVCNPFVIQLFIRVMRNARPFLLVALFLTASAGYFFNCIIVFCVFVLFLLLTSLETSVLIAYYIRVEDMHGTYDLSFMCYGVP